MNQEIGTGRAEVPRLAALDGLRGLAAVTVAFGFHYQIVLAPGIDFGGIGGQIVRWLFHYGWTMVDLFFVLSGYIFAHVYLSGPCLMTVKGQADFTIARLARLYPLHIFMLVVSALIFNGLPNNDVARFAAHMVMGQGLVGPVGQTYVGPSWSISVEVLCYILFSAAAFAGHRWLMVISVAAVVGAGLVLVIAGVEAAPTVATGLARGLLGFFTGQLLWRMRGVAVRVPTMVLLCGVAAGLAFGNGTLSLALGPVLPLTLLAWPCLLLCALRLRAFASAPAIWLGDRSYAIYLVHMPLIELVYHTGRLGMASTPWSLAMVYGALVLTTLVLADILFRKLERPARDVIRRWWGHRAVRLVTA